MQLVGHSTLADVRILSVVIEITQALEETPTRSIYHVCYGRGNSYIL